jgi:hypothetical protein
MNILYASPDSEGFDDPSMRRSKGLFGARCFSKMPAFHIALNRKSTLPVETNVNIGIQVVLM